MGEAWVLLAAAWFVWLATIGFVDGRARWLDNINAVLLVALIGATLVIGAKSL